MAGKVTDPEENFAQCLEDIAGAVVAELNRYVPDDLSELERARRLLARAGRRYANGVERAIDDFWPDILIAKDRELLDNAVLGFARLLQKTEAPKECARELEQPYQRFIESFIKHADAIWYDMQHGLEYENPMLALAARMGLDGVFTAHLGGNDE